MDTTTTTSHKRKRVYNDTGAQDSSSGGSGPASFPLSGVQAFANTFMTNPSGNDLQLAEALNQHNATERLASATPEDQSRQTYASSMLGPQYTITIPPTTEATFLAAQASEHSAAPRAEDDNSIIDPVAKQVHSTSDATTNEIPALPLADRQYPPNQSPPPPDADQPSPSSPATPPNDPSDNVVIGAAKPGHGSDEWHKVRKSNHKEVERRRRETINDGIAALSAIIPGTEKNKGKILSCAVSFINTLKENETQNIEKYTLEKLLTEQAITELGKSNDALRAEKKALEQELMAWRALGKRADLFPSALDRRNAEAISDEA